MKDGGYYSFTGYVIRCVAEAVERRAGTVLVTSVLTVGSGAGWGIPIASHTVNVTVGGIVKRPVESDGGIDRREHLCLTLSFDHDIVDGAPAARFTKALVDIIESGKALTESKDMQGVPQP